MLLTYSLLYIKPHVQRKIEMENIQWKCQLCNEEFEEKKLHCHIEGCDRVFFPDRTSSCRAGIRNKKKIGSPF